MATYSTLGSLFTAIADAIRSKKGTSASIKADDFPSEIASINTGPDDGKAWLTKSSAFSAAMQWWDITYGNGVFVTVPIGSSAAKAGVSQTGLNWNLANLPSAGSRYKVAYGKGVFVTLKDGSDLVAISRDGMTWSESAALPVSASWRALCYGAGEFLAISTSGHVVKSSDGVTWTSAATLSGSEYWTDVCYGEGVYVAVSGNPNSGSRAIAVSEDGVNWTVRGTALPGASDWRIRYAKGKFIAVGSRIGTTASRAWFAYSDSGVTWAGSQVNEIKYYYAICYGNGKFVAIASDGTGKYSLNGVTWTAMDFVSESNVYCVCHANGMFVAPVVNSRALMYSRTTKDY